jgi:hypothetical protein
MIEITCNTLSSEGEKVKSLLFLYTTRWILTLTSIGSLMYIIGYYRKIERQ